MLNPGDYSQTMIGPSEIFAADALRRDVARRDAWPYAHIFGPPNSIRRDPTGFTVAPIVGTQDVILEFDVPTGYQFIMTDLLIGAFTTGQIPAGAPGDFTLSVDKNTPLGGGALQGSPIADWNNFPFNIGSLVYGPWHLSRAELFAPEDAIRAKVLNNGLGAGAPNFFCAMFGGWLLPTEKRR